MVTCSDFVFNFVYTFFLWSLNPASSLSLEKALPIVGRRVVLRRHRHEVVARRPSLPTCHAQYTRPQGDPYSYTAFRYFLFRILWWKIFKIKSFIITWDKIFRHIRLFSVYFFILDIGFFIQFRFSRLSSKYPCLALGKSFFYTIRRCVNIKIVFPVVLVI